jgi:tetratricopeptide (TPR) repeat protein
MQMINSWNALALAALAVAVAGCATPAPDAPGRQVRGDPTALTVVAEIALERGDCRTAADSYLDAAMRSSAEVAKRATEVAITCNQLPVAWQAASRWRETAPEDANAAKVHAALSLKLHRLSEARQALDAYLASVGTAAGDKPLLELMALLADDAEAPTALAISAPAIDRRGVSPDILAALGELALRAWSFERAERYARRALERDPKNVAARRVLTRTYAAQGEAARAIDIARDLVQSDPEPERSRFELAETLAALDRLEESRLELERLRASQVPDGEIDKRLAVLAFESGDFGEAQRRFVELATEGEAREASLFYLADIAARDGDDEAALAGYRRLVDSSLALQARARAAALLYARSDRAEALELLDEYATQHPDSSFDIVLAKAGLLASQGDAVTGLELLDTALERYPGQPQLLYERAVMLERAGRIRDSIAAFEQLLADRPDDPTILNALGYTLSDHELELPRAETLIRRALAYSPDNPAMLDSLGWVRFRRGDTRGALPVLTRAWAIGRDAEIAAHLGEAQWVAGREQDARRTWAAALARHPDSDLLKATIGRFVTAND